MLYGNYISIKLGGGARKSQEQLRGIVRPITVGKIQASYMRIQETPGTCQYHGQFHAEPVSLRL